MKISLTDMTVQKLKPGEYFDTRTPAFGIRVGKHRRTWFITKGKERSKITLGLYPSLTLAEARKKALIAIGSPLEPIDAPNFPDARTDYLAQGKWRPRTKKVVTSSLKHFTWTKALDKITHDDVADALNAIEGDSAKAHALKDLRALFKWAARFVPQSPCLGFKSPRYKKRTRLLTDAEIKAIWNAAERMGVYGAQVQCAITTAQRIGQVIIYDRSWTHNDRIVFPGSIMKGGIDHAIPLSDMTAGLLPKLQKTTYQGKPKKELDRLSGVTKWTIHDIRRYFSSTMAKLHVPIDITEAILSHRTGSRTEVQQIYDLYDRMDEMRDALSRYEDHLKAILSAT